MKLTVTQKNFLLECFFKNEAYAGWRNIADKLLDSGFCTVAGNKCIWLGGVGNYIKVEEAEDLIGCCKYTFDLEDFLTSGWFKQVHSIYITELAQKKKKIEDEYNEIGEL